MVRSLIIACLLATSAGAEDYYRPLVIGFDVSDSKDDTNTKINPVEEYKKGVLMALQDETVHDALLNCNIQLIGYTWAGLSYRFIATTSPEEFSKDIAVRGFSSNYYMYTSTKPAVFLKDIQRSEDIISRNPIIIILHDSAGINDVPVPQVVGTLENEISTIVHQYNGSVHLISLPHQFYEGGYTSFADVIKAEDKSATAVKADSPDDFVRAFEEILATQCRMG